MLFQASRKTTHEMPESFCDCDYDCACCDGGGGCDDDCRDCCECDCDCCNGGR